MEIKGLEIFVEKIQGSGSWNFVLIHNAGGDHRFFTHQIDLLKTYGNVILLDLPGCGGSSPSSKCSMGELSEIIEEVCSRLSLTDIVLIGLNNGGNIALELVRQGKVSIEALLLIDPPIFLGQSFRDEIEAYIASLEKAEFTEQYVLSLVNELFLETGSKNKEIAMSAFSGVDKKSLQGMFRGLLDHDETSFGSLKNVKHPTLCILTDEHHCSFARIKEEAPQFTIGKVIGSKCWATLEVPEQINAMVSRFLHLLASKIA